MVDVELEFELKKVNFVILSPDKILVFIGVYIMSPIQKFLKS